MEKFIGKVKPSVLAAVLGLVAICLYSLRVDQENIAALAAAGLLAIGKDILQSDGKDD